MDGIILRASSIHIAFIVSEAPRMAPIAITMLSSKPSEVHSTRRARSSAFCCSGGSLYFSPVAFMESPRIATAGGEHRRLDYRDIAGRAKASRSPREERLPRGAAREA